MFNVLLKIIARFIKVLHEIEKTRAAQISATNKKITALYDKRDELAVERRQASRLASRLKDCIDC